LTNFVCLYHHLNTSILKDNSKKITPQFDQFKK
jgi:hypothetical protein